MYCFYATLEYYEKGDRTLHYFTVCLRLFLVTSASQGGLCDYYVINCSYTVSKSGH